MGVVDLFDSTKADLSNMTPTEMTALEGVIHQGLIEVSEAGTEGAAITEVFGNRISAGNSFVANRPFLYFVMDRTTRTALFFGRVVRPIFWASFQNSLHPKYPELLLSSLTFI